MKAQRPKDPARFKAGRSSSEDRIPESPNQMPKKYMTSDMTPPNTYSSNPMSFQNKEIEAEEMLSRTFFYNNVDPRRKQELSDSRMIQEDHNAMANLSNVPAYSTFNPDAYPERLAMYNQSTKTKR